MARLPYSLPGARGAAELQGRAAQPGSSGTQRLGIAALRAILCRYISPLLLDSVLNRALEHHSSEGLPADDLLKVVAADCMIGLRLFVKPDLLPELMLELAELLEEGG